MLGSSCGTTSHTPSAAASLSALRMFENLVTRAGPLDGGRPRGDGSVHGAVQRAHLCGKAALPLRPAKCMHCSSPTSGTATTSTASTSLSSPSCRTPSYVAAALQPALTRRQVDSVSFVSVRLRDQLHALSSLAADRSSTASTRSVHAAVACIDVSQSPVANAGFAIG